ncbi:Oidioi.mRNA.OKI2018_I69.chr2.g4582.t1.cds [Oikopleura dioica]|uniref:Ubiquitin carboxyl-terminal hydrolase n=1 Tax=Oikopleura dioica TaxID=34765 RepID=A0ABN7T230_OIKDI|nr:Oidioi.mRNA.OKI2018_I69.chr2.g4582.t1.cds [Oikopleura dioica]
MNDVLRNTLDALSRSTSSGEDRWERIRSQEESNEIKRKEQKISAAAGPIKKDEKKKSKKVKESENRVIEISGSDKSASEKSRSKKSQKSKSKDSSSKSAKTTQATGEKAIKPKQELKPTRTITVAQPPAKPQPLSRKPVNNSLDSLSTIPSSYQVPPSSHEPEPVQALKVVAKPKLNATQLAQRKDADERAFMAKLQARKNATEPGNTDAVNFKPRTEIEHAAVLEVAGKLKPKPRATSVPRKIEVAPVKPKQAKPEVIKSTPVAPVKSENVVYQNPENPFGTKEVYVPPKCSVTAMAKIFGANVGLEDQSAPERSKSEATPISDQAKSAPAKVSPPDLTKNLIGIKNSGNTCYISVALQCLYQIEPLREFLLSGEYKKHLNETSPADGEIAELTAEIFGKMKNLEKNISVEDLKEAVAEFSGMFEDDEQEDAEEFLLTLIDGLHLDLEKSTGFTESENSPKTSEEAWNQYISEENSFLTSLFVGQAESTLTCLSCQESTKNWESFWNISLPISGSSSIEECIEEFQKSETLSDEDQPFCDACQKKCDMTKTLRISRIPKVLLLHLKRFSSKSKDSSLIKFPVSSPLLLDSSKFQLSSVINHEGKSTSSGHYVASVKDNGSWFSISDEKVSALESVLSEKAYVLFYTTC